MVLTSFPFRTSIRSVILDRIINRQVGNKIISSNNQYREQAISAITVTQLVHYHRWPILEVTSNKTIKPLTWWTSSKTSINPNLNGSHLREWWIMEDFLIRSIHSSNPSPNLCLILNISNTDIILNHRSDSSFQWANHNKFIREIQWILGSPSKRFINQWISSHISNTSIQFRILAFLKQILWVWFLNLIIGNLLARDHLILVWTVE